MELLSNIWRDGWRIVSLRFFEGRIMIALNLR